MRRRSLGSILLIAAWSVMVLCASAVQHPANAHGQPAIWVVSSGPHLGLQLYSPAERPDLLPASLNGATGAVGRIVPAPGDPAAWRYLSPSGTALPVVSRAALSEPEALLSDAWMQLRYGGFGTEEATAALLRHAADILEDPGGTDPNIPARADAMGLLLDTLDRITGITERAGTRASEAEAAASGLQASLRALRSGSSGILSSSSDRITIDPVVVDFGTVCVGERVDMTLTVTNKTAIARDVRLRETADIPVLMPEGQTTVVPSGGTQTLTLRFESSTPGKFRRSVFMRALPSGATGHDAGIFISLAGEAVNVLFTPSPLDFGEVVIGQQRTLPLTIRNCTDQPLSGTLQNAVDYSVEAPNPFVLAPGASQQVNVTFAPKIAGLLPESIHWDGVNHRGRKKTIGSAPLSGTGKEPVKVGATRLDFGTVARNQIHERALEVTNVTDQTQVVQVDGSHLDSRYFSIVPSGSVALAPNGALNVRVRFGAIAKCVHRGTLFIRGPGLSGGQAKVQVTARIK